MATIKRGVQFTHRRWLDASNKSPHDCMENAVPYTSDGAIGHG